jgi:predicted Fe-S protein YdhL (DUF1289 family)
MERYYNTATVDIDDKKYCAYCSKEAKRVIRYGSYHNNIDDEIYYNCECEDAENEMQIKLKKQEMQKQVDYAFRDELWELQRKANKNSPNLKKLEYQIKLDRLNKQYNIE